MSQSTNPQVQAGPQGSVPPGGPPNPNPTDHNLTGIAADRGPIVIGVISFLWALTIVALSLRMISRYIAKCKWWWDDYLALVAWAFYSIIAASLIYCVTPAVGGAQHSWMVSYPQLMKFLKMQSMEAAIYPLSMGAAKCSVITFYVRVFGIQRKFKLWCYCLLGLVIAWSISTFLVTVFQCLPVDIASDMFSNRACINQQAFLLTAASLDGILTFLTLVLPLYSIWKLQLSTRRKIVISGVLLIGVAELAFTITRVVVLANSSEWVDIPWDFYSGYIWANVQRSVGIVCICLPALGPLLRHRSKSSPKPPKYPGLGNSNNTILIDSVMFNQSTLDERSNSEISAKSVQGLGNSIAISSYPKEGDEASI